MEIRVQDYVIQIDFVDRLGLAYEIFEVFRDKKINLIGMEATSNERMMIKCQIAWEHLQGLMNELITIQGVKALGIRDYLLCEQREHELRTILNSVNEGIVAVNKEGIITHFNEVACQTFFCTKEEAVGKKIEDILHTKTPIFDTLKSGQPYNLKEVKLQKDNQNIHFMVSFLPILNDKEDIIGGVATINDFRRVEELVSKVGGKKRLTTFDDIIHQSATMNRIVEMSKAVAKGNSTILLRGESGTGKELFAKAIHMESNRAQGSFIAINCGALPDSLLESELFGYQEGAFTGASKGGRKGLFEQANEGTLFLDELGEVSPQLQVRLLRVLQENTVRRVGGNKEIPVDVRIIGATHRNLEEMIQKGDFREDLYYRLNVLPIRILPLRERTEDIPMIAQHLIRKICTRLSRPEICLTRESIKFLMKQDWPGNIRQLENVLERIINVMDLSEIKLEDFYSSINLWQKDDTEDMIAHQPLFGSLTEGTKDINSISDQDFVSEERNDKNTMNEQDSYKITVRRNYSAPDNSSSGEKGQGALYVRIPFTAKWPPLKTIVSEVEKLVLLTVLQKYPSSRKAGKALGISGTSILNKMNAYGIAFSKDEDESL